MRIQKGQRHPFVAEVRRKLHLTTPVGAGAFAFDEVVEEAVKAFQERVGLPVSGELDDATLTTLRSS